MKRRGDLEYWESGSAGGTDNLLSVLRSSKRSFTSSALKCKVFVTNLLSLCDTDDKSSVPPAHPPNGEEEGKFIGRGEFFKSRRSPFVNRLSPEPHS